MSDDNASDDSITQKPLYLFGKDVREIQCFRKSFVYGILLGFTGGLGTFLFTSKVRLSTHVAFGSLWLGVFGYWIPCRIHYENTTLCLEVTKRNVQLGHDITGRVIK